MKSAKRDVHKNIFFCFISLQIFRHKLTGKHLIKSNNVSWQKIFFEFLISKVHKYNLNFNWHYNHNNSIFFNKKDLAISDTGCWKKTKQLTFFFSLQRLNYDPIIMKLISQCLWDYMVKKRMNKSSLSLRVGSDLPTRLVGSDLPTRLVGSDLPIRLGFPILPNCTCSRSTFEFPNRVNLSGPRLYCIAMTSDTWSRHSKN